MGSSTCKSLLFAAVIVFCSGAAAPVLAQCAPDTPYQQSDAVKRRYPDPPVQFDTPAFAAGKQDFTSHEELMRYVEDLARSSDNLLVRRAGLSQEGRALPALVFSSTGRFAPAELRRPAKPIVFMVGQVHGNEPASGEAMLVVAKALATGELSLCSTTFPSSSCRARTPTARTISGAPPRAAST